MEDSTFAAKHTALTENRSDQTPACVSPIDFITGEEGSDSSSSSSWGDDLDLETLIRSFERRLIRKRKPRKRRSLKEIQEIGPVDENLKIGKQKVVVVVPPGFLQPLSEIAGQSLDGQNIDSFRKQNLNPGYYGNSKIASSEARKRGRPRKKTASGDYCSSKTASSSFIKVAKKRGRPRKKTASGEGVLPYKNSTFSYSTLNMSIHDNPSHNWNSPSRKFPSSPKASHMIDCGSTIRSSNIQLVSSLQELDTVITGDDEHEFSVKDGATKFKDDETVGLSESAEALAAAALDTNDASTIDKSDLLEKKLKETKKLGEVLATMLAEERRKFAEDEHKLRRRLEEASETIEALHEKLMFLRSSSCIGSFYYTPQAPRL